VSVSFFTPVHLSSFSQHLTREVPKKKTNNKKVSDYHRDIGVIVQKITAGIMS